MPFHGEGTLYLSAIKTMGPSTYKSENGDYHIRMGYSRLQCKLICKETGNANWGWIIPDYSNFLYGLCPSGTASSMNQTHPLASQGKPLPALLGRGSLTL